jgi:hypothetical protein
VKPKNIIFKILPILFLYFRINIFLYFIEIKNLLRIKIKNLRQYLNKIILRFILLELFMFSVFGPIFPLQSNTVGELSTIENNSNSSLITKSDSEVINYKSSEFIKYWNLKNQLDFYIDNNHSVSSNENTRIRWNEASLRLFEEIKEIERLLNQTNNSNFSLISIESLNSITIMEELDSKTFKVLLRNLLDFNKPLHPFLKVKHLVIFLISMI